MKIPKYINKLLERRVRLAEDLNSVDCKITKWITDNDIKVEEYDYNTFDVYHTEVDWNKLSLKDKLYSDLVMCCGCGTYHKKDKMFIKQYSNKAICLCKKCAKELYNDIEQFDIGYNDTMNKSELMDWYINSVSPDDKPVWTEEHIDELINDFYVIPKDQ